MVCSCVVPSICVNILLMRSDQRFFKYDNKLGDRMIKQLLDEVEQNIVICQCLADQLFASALGFGK